MKTRRSILMALALAWAPLAGPAARADGWTQAPPAAARFRLGDLELTALRDGGYVSPNDGGDYGSDAGPNAVGEVLSRAGAPVDTIAISINALLVRLPGRLVLLDTGLGPSEHGALIESLRLAGVAPAQVTDVLITHWHPDHVGGLVGADGRSAFPNAAIWVSQKEWAWARPASRRVAPVLAAQVRTFAPGGEILPGVRTIALYGHTPGHVGYEIVSAGRSIEDIGDTAHSSIVDLAHPEWLGWIDEDPKAAARTRQAELARLAAARGLVFSPHFPFPGVGWIERRGAGYAWTPDPEVKALRGAGPQAAAGPIPRGVER